MEEQLFRHNLSRVASPAVRRQHWRNFPPSTCMDLALQVHTGARGSLQSAERYGRLAFKAQSNCRATLEALAKLHQPREQTVKHVHVNEGGQAVVADQFHQHTGGRENAKSNGQPHALESMGAASGQPLRSANPVREALPIASDA